MTKSTTAKVEDIAQEAAALPPEPKLAEDLSALMARLAEENETLKEEMHAMKARLTDGLKQGHKDLKAEIAHHPMQSVVTSFALGFVAALLMRR